jgi:hypothetical protein
VYATKVDDAATGGTKRRREEPSAEVASDIAARLTAIAKRTMSRQVPASSTPGGRSSTVSSAKLLWPQVSSAWLRRVDTGGVTGSSGSTVEYNSHTTSSMTGAPQSVLSADDTEGTSMHSTVDVEAQADFPSFTVHGVDVLSHFISSSQDFGAYSYEVEIQSDDGLVQIGWATSSFRPNMEDGDGTGDDAFSWGFDGKRRAKFHAGDASEYGRVWSTGDVVTCIVLLSANADAVQATFSFCLNGEELGEAFTHSFSKSDDLSPAVSLENGQALRVNLGQAGFSYPIGTTPVYAARRLGADSVKARAAGTGVNEEGSVSQHGAASFAGDAVPSATSTVTDLSCCRTQEQLRTFGVTMEALKLELTALGLKSGGTWEERAERLLAVAGLTVDQVPQKLRAKEFPGPRWTGQ